MDKKDVEILSPVGSIESVPAAVLNGADAVYLGLSEFSARQNAKNFTVEQLNTAVKYCHLRGVKVYLAINTVVFDEDLPRLIDTLKTACELKVDALIVQDFGVLRIVKECCPDMPVHASTQMTVHTVSGTKQLKAMGASRVVLAREMSAAGIKRIKDEVDIETEVFVHGALCMSVSGQCYMSAAIGTRSGNRGSCAGSCRLPFGVLSPNDYDLSLKDLCLAEHFDKLVSLGVNSLKIEGRMKRPEYVAAATRAYSGLKNNIMPDTDMLRAVFSRNGFTDGYFSSKITSDMFGHRGKEDVLSTTDNLLSALKETYRKEVPVIPLKAHFYLKADKKAKLYLSDPQGNEVEVYGQTAQKAKTLPLTEKDAKTALGKLGSTPFYLDKFDADIDSGLMLPKSALNALRRSAVEELSECIQSKKEVEFKPIELKSNRRECVAKKALRARFLSVSQIPFETLDKLQYIYLPFREVQNNKDILIKIKDKIIVEPDRVMFENEQENIESLGALRDDGFDKMSVSNPAHIFIGNTLGFTLFGTMFLNITNSKALAQYGELGIKDTAVSFECSANKINRLDNSFSSLGAVLYGYLPLMIVRNCPIKRHINCGECKGTSTLTDRLGNKFRVICKKGSYSEILNCKRLYLADKTDKFSGIDYGILYFTVETKDECKAVIDNFILKSAPSGEFTRGLYFRGIS